METPLVINTRLSSFAVFDDDYLFSMEQIGQS
jgi:hypothetical protein